MTDDGSGGGGTSTESLLPRRDSEADHDDDALLLAGRRLRTEKLTDIRGWLAAVFARSVKVGERLLEDGRVAEAAVAFANATLLTDRAVAFAAAVRRVYPSYFYRLFERRMTVMGYGHLFAVTADRTTATVAVDTPPRHGSPNNGSQQQRIAEHSSDLQPSRPPSEESPPMSVRASKTTTIR